METTSPTNVEIKALISYGRNQGRKGKDDKGKAETMLFAMQKRGVNLRTVQQTINDKVFDERGVQEFVADRIKYVETGEEDAWSRHERASRTSEAKGKKTRRHRKKSNKQQSRRRSRRSRRH
jgi:hypothetical protein